MLEHEEREETKRNKAGMHEADMHMLAWTYKNNRISKSLFRKNLLVAPVTEIVREGCLRWFGHVYRN